MKTSLSWLEDNEWLILFQKEMETKHYKPTFRPPSSTYESICRRIENTSISAIGSVISRMVFFDGENFEIKRY
jgi:hypothetical protein